MLIRYKGNINNTSVIIFFNCRTKTPRDVTLLGRTSEEVFMMLLFFISFLYLHFIFDLNFVVVLHLLFFFIHICFSTSSLTLAWTIAGFLYRFYTFRPAHRRVIRHNFINQPFRYLFAERYGLEWAFFTHRRFLPYAPSPTFYPAFIKTSLGAGSSSLNLKGFIRISKHRPGPSVCLIDSNPQSSYSEQFSFKFYQILS